MPTNQDKLGAIKRPTKWLEKIFFTEEDMFNGLEEARQEAHVY